MSDEELPDIAFDPDGMPVVASVYERWKALDKALERGRITAAQHKELCHTCALMLRDYRAEMRDAKIATLKKIRDEIRAAKLAAAEEARARAGGRAEGPAVADDMTLIVEEKP